MAEPISNEIREKIVIHKLNKVKQSDIAKWLIISESSVTKVWRLYRQTGSWLPNPKNSGRKPLVSDETMQKIVGEIDKNSDITLSELIDLFELIISESALCKRLVKLGLTFKKRRSIPTAKNVPTLSKSVKIGKKK
jgi:transposase